MRFDRESRESLSLRKMKSLYRSIRVFLRTEILELTYDVDIAALYFPRLIERTSALCQRIHMSALT
jgi:hypothetical protein